MAMNSDNPTLAADPGGPSIEPARWPAVAFVCNRCQDRKGAPKGLDAKRLGRRLREGFRDAGLRSRVVGTGCMGLCPRGEVVAAVSLRGGPLVVAELGKKREADTLVDRLVARTSPSKEPA